MPKRYNLTNATLSGRNKRIWEMHLDDWTQTEIASEVGLSQQRVSAIIAECSAGVTETPREQEMRTRHAQVAAKISYWAAIVQDESLPLDDRIKADKRLGYWYDFRARLRAEYAPSSMYIQAGQGGDQMTYRLELDEATRKALT